MITLGIALGLSAALTAAGMMEDLVYDVPTRDPETFVGVSIALVLAALAACCVPARRAMRTDPASILRYE